MIIFRFFLHRKLAEMFAVVTQSRTYLSIPDRWIESKGEIFSKFFYSPNHNEKEEFNLPTKYFFAPDTPACYNAKIIRPLGTFSFFYI